jgi:hypothetical protein
LNRSGASLGVTHHALEVKNMATCCRGRLASAAASSRSRAPHPGQGTLGRRAQDRSGNRIAGAA